MHSHVHGPCVFHVFDHPYSWHHDWRWAALGRLERETGIYIRFAIGEVPEEQREAIAQEEEKHGSFLRIPLKVPLSGMLQHPQGRCRHQSCMLP